MLGWWRGRRRRGLRRWRRRWRVAVSRAVAAETPPERRWWQRRRRRWQGGHPRGDDSLTSLRTTTWWSLRKDPAGQHGAKSRQPRGPLRLFLPSKGVGDELGTAGDGTEACGWVGHRRAQLGENQRFPQIGVAALRPAHVHVIRALNCPMRAARLGPIEAAKPPRCDKLRGGSGSGKLLGNRQPYRPLRGRRSNWTTTCYRSARPERARVERRWVQTFRLCRGPHRPWTTFDVCCGAGQGAEGPNGHAERARRRWLHRFRGPGQSVAAPAQTAERLPAASQPRPGEWNGFRRPPRARCSMARAESVHC